MALMTKLILQIAALCMLVVSPCRGTVEQVHVSLYEAEDDAFTITWLSNNTGDFNVQFSVTGGPTVFVAKPEIAGGTSYTYTPLNCVTYTSANIFVALLRLGPYRRFGQPTAVTYSIQDLTDGSLSQKWTYQLPPALGSPVKLALIGDLGQTQNSSDTINHVLAGISQPSGAEKGSAYAAAIIAGDLSYADAEKPGALCGRPSGCVPERWDSFGRLYEQLGAVLPTITCPGNHETEVPEPGFNTTGNCSTDEVTTTPFVEWENRYRPLEVSEKTRVGNPLYYSLEIGNIHVVMINSYQNFVEPETWGTNESDQYKWLVDDLAHVNRYMTPWVIVVLHAPWYNSNSHHQNETEEYTLRILMEPVLYRYQVDVLFAGHVHSYERTFPVYNGSLATNSANHHKIEINIGDGGNREGVAVPWLPISEFPWSAYREAEFGHGSFETLNNTVALWTWHKNNGSEATDVGDQIYIIKANTGLRVYDVDRKQPNNAGQEWVAPRQVDLAYEKRLQMMRKAEL
eukprot:m.1261150 g.1261150  ORF g.1261150 m.1261150 type:complete len:514 (-) comp24730_c0_seq10:3210-4751(-)